jgi:RNA polymerase sigma-70 factor (ECF subfamily)
MHTTPTEADAPSTDELVRRVLAGDTAAFATVIRRYENDVWKIVALMLRDRATTENLVQQCFVNAYEHLGQFELGRDFGRWLRAIARNLVRNELRRGSREGDHLGEYRAYLAAQEDAGRAEEGEQRLRAALEECRKEIPPLWAQALALRYEEALPLEEVASAIGRTVVAARQLLFRLRVTLRDCVEKRMALP